MITNDIITDIETRSPVLPTPSELDEQHVNSEAQQSLELYEQFAINETSETILEIYSDNELESAPSSVCVNHELYPVL